MNRQKDNRSPPDPSRLGERTKIKRVYSPKYEYQPLDPDKNEIRLIRVKPANFPTDTINCELFHTTLEDAPPYQALSYTWGDLEGSRDIYINGMWLSATANLRHAIQRLRPKEGDPEFILWVDAISINQEDIPERNVQTGKMRLIYQNATTVCVWLGRQNHESGPALGFVESLSRCSSEAEVSDMVQDPSRVDQLRALVLLFRRSYWWRIWVIQEIQSAQNAMVYCGANVIPWPVLDKVCDILRSEEAHLQKLYYDSPSFIRTLVSGGPRGLQLSRYSANAHSPPLLDLLLSHKSKKSTDPKDKVYALVGISSSRNSFGPIDYGKSVREIYTHTCRHIITTSQKLDVICARQHDLDQYQLPTWAPDWTRPPPHPEHTVIGLHHSEADFEAAGESIADAEFLEGGYVLKTSGVIIETVKSLSVPFKRFGAQSETKPVLRAFRQWWKQYVAERGDSVSAQAAFCRIISCGNWDSDVDDEYTTKLNSIFDFYNTQLSEQTERRMEPLPVDDSSDTIVVQSEEQYEKSQVATILSASLTMNKRRLFISSSEVVGLAPWNSEEGDHICVLYGCRFPVILRRQDDHYILIGEAYVDGFMFAEAMRGLETGIYAPTEFRIH